MAKSRFLTGDPGKPVPDKPSFLNSVPVLNLTALAFVSA
jgi:hypothetical protein